MSQVKFGLYVIIWHFPFRKYLQSIYKKIILRYKLIKKPLKYINLAQNKKNHLK